MTTPARCDGRLPSSGPVAGVRRVPALGGWIGS